MALIATKPELSYLSTLIRYEELYIINPNQTRATPKEHHDFIVNHLVDNTRQLEELAILKEFKFTNEIEVVYMIQKKIQLQQQMFFKSYCLEWSQVEKEMLQVGEKRLNELLEK